MRKARRSAFGIWLDGDSTTIIRFNPIAFAKRAFSSSCFIASAKAASSADAYGTGRLQTAGTRFSSLSIARVASTPSALAALKLTSTPP